MRGRLSSLRRCVFIVMIFFTHALASVSQANEQPGLCVAWENIARAAMTARQAGVPLQTMLTLVSDETAISIFRLAYNSPRHTDDAEQQSAINDFAGVVVSQCVKNR